MHTIVESESVRVTIGADQPLRIVGECAAGDATAAEVEALIGDQLDGGAHVLGLDLALSADPGAAADAVRRTQRITDRPLCLRAGATAALAAALGAYRGKALVRAPATDDEGLAALLPVVRRYAAALIATPVADATAPPTARGRLERTHRIIDAAAGCYDLPIEDVLIDPILDTGSPAEVTLATIAAIGEEYGVNMALAIGTDAAALVDDTFLAAARDAGLTCAVVNAHTYTAMALLRAADTPPAHRLATFGTA